MSSIKGERKFRFLKAWWYCFAYTTFGGFFSLLVSVPLGLCMAKTYLLYFLFFLIFPRFSFFFVSVFRLVNVNRNSISLLFFLSFFFSFCSLLIALKLLNASNSSNSNYFVVLLCWLVPPSSTKPPVAAFLCLTKVVIFIASPGPSRFCILVTGLTLATGVFSSTICGGVQRMTPLGRLPLIILEVLAWLFQLT